MFVTFLAVKGSEVSDPHHFDISQHFLSTLAASPKGAWKSHCGLRLEK